MLNVEKRLSILLLRGRKNRIYLNCAVPRAFCVMSAGHWKTMYQWYARQHTRAILSAGQHYNSVIRGKTLHARKNTQPVLSVHSVQQTKQIIWVSRREIAGLRALFARKQQQPVLSWGFSLWAGLLWGITTKKQVSYYCYQWVLQINRKLSYLTRLFRFP